jgi:regulatory protein
MKTDQQDKNALRRAAMDLLARREHSAYELKQKLSKRTDNQQLLDEVVAQLQEDRLQDDRRFAAAYIRHRASNGYATRFIVQELKQKGVAATDVQTALADMDIAWDDILFDLHQKKYGEQAPNDLKEKAKRSQFLLRRGFSFDQLDKLWRSL